METEISIWSKRVILSNIICTVIVCATILSASLYISYLVLNYPQSRQRADHRDLESPGTDYSFGPTDATVVVLEFTDFECTFCRELANQVMPALRKTYGGQVKFIHKDFPLPIHTHALEAAVAARCAGEQGRFWEYRERLFKSKYLSSAQILSNSSELNLDLSKFKACLGEDTIRESVTNNIRQGKSIGVSGTPTVFIDGRKYPGLSSLNILDRAVAEALFARKH